MPGCSSLPRDEAQGAHRRSADPLRPDGHRDALASDLPLGMRQRLALAVALVHKPDLLILDEPTSGVDPIARDEFWALLIELSRDQGVTIFISTHFMNEAARCDRISLMDSGRDPGHRHAGGAGREREARPISKTRSSLSRRGRRGASDDRRRRQRRAAGSSRRVEPANNPVVQFPPHDGLYDPRNPGVVARSDPPGLRLVRPGVADAGAGLRHHDRCRFL